MDIIGHILIVDDDQRIRNLLKRFLIQHRYIVSTAANTAECENLLSILKFDTIIMDVMMPGESGQDYLKRKSNLNIPVIMLSALGDVDDRIGGLESGADDYLTKPFEPQELLIRIHKLMSRSAKKAITEFGTYTFDQDSLNLYSNGTLIKLTSAEKKILQKLAETPNTTVSKYKLQVDNDTHSRAIDTQIARLRNKLEDDPKNPLYIQTIRGEGYMLWCTNR